MKLTFIGDPNDNNAGPRGKDGVEDKTITICGVKFKKDEITEVSEEVYKRLKGNSHFKAPRTRKKASD